MSQGITIASNLDLQAAVPFANTPQLAKLGSIGNEVESGQLNVREVEQNRNYTRFDAWGNALTQADQRLFAAGASNSSSAYNLGQPVWVDSADAGSSWSFVDVSGQPIYSRGARTEEIYIAYDVVQRPMAQFVRCDSDDLSLRNTTQVLLYGDAVDAAGNVFFANPERANLRGQVVAMLDESGLHASPIFDVQGASLASRTVNEASPER